MSSVEASSAPLHTVQVEHCFTLPSRLTVFHVSSRQSESLFPPWTPPTLEFLLQPLPNHVPLGQSVPISCHRSPRLTKPDRTPSSVWWFPSRLVRGTPPRRVPTTLQPQLSATEVLNMVRLNVPSLPQIAVELCRRWERWHIKQIINTVKCNSSIWQWHKLGKRWIETGYINHRNDCLCRGLLDSPGKT